MATEGSRTVDAVSEFFVIIGTRDGCEYGRQGDGVYYRSHGDVTGWRFYCRVDEWASKHEAGFLDPIATPMRPADDLAVLRSQHAADTRVLDEGGAPPDDASIAALAKIIRSDPLRAAIRWLNLEAEVRLQRSQLDMLRSDLEQRRRTGR